MTRLARRWLRPCRSGPRHTTAPPRQSGDQRGWADVRPAQEAPRRLPVSLVVDRRFRSGAVAVVPEDRTAPRATVALLVAGSSPGLGIATEENSKCRQLGSRYRLVN